jgi:hypothetical protein
MPYSKFDFKTGHVSGFNTCWNCRFSVVIIFGRVFQNTGNLGNLTEYERKRTKLVTEG